MEGLHIPGPAYGAVDSTAELLAKLLSGSKNLDVTALSEAVRAKLGITEPLTKPSMASASSGLTSLADDVKLSRVSRLLPKVTCPGPFHPRATTVPNAELQDVPVTEAEKNELRALAPLAGRLAPPSDPTLGCGKGDKPAAQANIELELPDLDPSKLGRMGRRISRISSAYRPVSCGCGDQMFACEAFMQKEIFPETRCTDCQNLFNWVEVLQRLGKTFPVDETDLSVRTQIEELPMLPEFRSAARISKYVCDLEYVFSGMNGGSYGPTEPNLWLVGGTLPRTWQDCRSTCQRKRRTDRYDDLVHLLIESALERDNDSPLKRFLRRHLGKGGSPTPDSDESRGSKNPTKSN